jgi:hypothetical protein
MDRKQYAINEGQELISKKTSFNWGGPTNEFLRN